MINVKYTGVRCCMGQCNNVAGAKILVDEDDAVSVLQLPPAWAFSVNYSDIDATVQVQTLSFFCHKHRDKAAS